MEHDQTKEWMVRFDNDGVAYDNFLWKPLGEWTVAPDWNPKPCCGYGLHGQGPGGFGHTCSGSRFAFCIIGDKVVINKNKIKTNRAKIIAVNDEAFHMLLKACNGNFLGSLDLRKYGHSLPKSFTHCGGSLYLGNYSHSLPEGFTHCGGKLTLNNYDHPLPKSFTHCEGGLYLDNCRYLLPEGFTHCGGRLTLNNYEHSLPKGFISYK